MPREIHWQALTTLKKDRVDIIPVSWLANKYPDLPDSDNFSISFTNGFCLGSAEFYLFFRTVFLIKSLISSHTRFISKADHPEYPTKLYASWIKIDQLDVTCFIISLFTAQHVSNVSTSIFRSLRLICGFISRVVLLWFDMCWCYGVVRLGWSGILMQAEALLQPA